MVEYIVRRLALMVPTAFLVTVGVFMLIHLIPGDPATVILAESYTPEAAAKIHQDLGLDQPLPKQYLIYMGKLAHGDLGSSVRNRLPVTQAIGERLPATLELGLAALLWSLMVAIPLGAIAALRRGRALDVIASGLTVAGISIPNFVLGILLILLFGLVLRVLPVGGFAALTDSVPDNLSRLILPAIALGTFGAASNMRFTRSSMIEVLHEDYIRTATSKGLAPRVVMSRHALRNALIPVTSALGALVPRLLGGTVVTEAVFGWPGMGRLGLEAAQGRDYPLVTGLTVAVAAIAVLASLLVDLAYTRIDPRVRLG